MGNFLTASINCSGAFSHLKCEELGAHAVELILNITNINLIFNFN